MLRQFKHLDLRSPRNTSDTDMFQSDDESLSLSVCKAAQCDLSAEEDGAGPGEPKGSMFLSGIESKTAQSDLSAEDDGPSQPPGAVLTNETVYEDCREEAEESYNDLSIKQNQEVEADDENPELTDTTGTVDNSVLTDEQQSEGSETEEDCDGEDEDIDQNSPANSPNDGESDASETEEDGSEGEHNSQEQSEAGEAEGRDNSPNKSATDDEQLEAKTEGGESEYDSLDEEEEFEEEEEEEESSEGSDESFGDPSWNADEPTDSSDEEEQEEEARKVRGSTVPVPRDLSLVDVTNLSLCLSPGGPIKLAVRCGCRGSCVRSCKCRSAGEECSRWCSCLPSKCKSKLHQKYPDGEFCVSLGHLDF